MSFLSGGLWGENHTHWRILRCHCPQVVSQMWQVCTLKDIEMLLSSGSLSEVRIMYTEGYWDVIVLSWSLRRENYAHWRILSCCCNQLVYQRWELCILKDIEMSFLSGGLWGENHTHWRILRCHCSQVVSQRWEVCTLKVIEMTLSSDGLSEVIIMHTKGYQAAIVLRWSLRGENYAHWRILGCHCPQVVSLRW